MAGKRIKPAAVQRRVVGPVSAPVAPSTPKVQPEVSAPVVEMPTLTQVPPTNRVEAESTNMESSGGAAQPKEGRAPKRAKSRRGRPAKAPDQRVLPINLTIDPKLHKKLEQYIESLNQFSPVDVPKSQFVSFALEELLDLEPREAFGRFVARRRKPPSR